MSRELEEGCVCGGWIGWGSVEYLAIFDDAVFETPWRDERRVFGLPMMVELFLCEVGVALDEASDCDGTLGRHFGVD